MSARTVFAHSAILTWLLIAILALVYAYEIPSGGSAMAGASASVLNALGALNHSAIQHGEYFRFFTAPFLHANLLHLLANIISLALIGPLVEVWLNKSALLAIFCLGGIAGTVASYTYGDPSALSVGASGAVFALAICAFLVVPPKLDQAKERLKLLLWIAPNVATLLPLGILSLPPTDHMAHAGGALLGAAVGIATLVARNRSPTAVGLLVKSFHATSALLILAVAVSAPKAVSLWRSAMETNAEWSYARTAKSNLNYAEAIDAYAAILRRSPNDVIARVELAQAYSLAGDHQSALSHFQRAVKQDIRAARQVFNEGVTIFNAGNRARAAESYFRMAAYADPTLKEAWQNLILCLVMQERHETAKYEIRRAMNENEKYETLLDYYQELKSNCPRAAQEESQTVETTGKPDPNRHMIEGF